MRHSPRHRISPLRIITIVLVLFSLSISFIAYARTCSRCHGTGRIYYQRGGTGNYGANSAKSKCPECGQMISAGVSHSHPCPDCNGTGEIQSGTKPSQHHKNSQSGHYSEPQQYGLTPEQYNAGLEAMNAQLRGHHGEEGAVNGPRVFGSCRLYNPNGHNSQSSVTGKINELGRVENVAFSSTGAIMTYDSYGFQCAGVPQAFIDAIADVNRQQLPIRDIALSEDNRYWAVIYGANAGTAWRAYAPDDVYNKLNDVFSRGSSISSVWIGNDGKYIVVGDDGIAVGTNSLIGPINDAIRRFGKVKSVSADTFDRMVICCERGVYCRATPSSISDKLLELDWLPRVVKFNVTGHYFIGGYNGQYAYWF